MDQIRQAGTRDFIQVVHFFFNDTATTEIYTLSLHDALRSRVRRGRGPGRRAQRSVGPGRRPRSRRSEEHTSELQSLAYLVCRLLLEKKNISDRQFLTPHASNHPYPRHGVPEIHRWTIETYATSARKTTYAAFLFGWIFFFNDTATTEIYALSLHDALPI